MTAIFDSVQDVSDDYHQVFRLGASDRVTCAAVTFPKRIRGQHLCILTRPGATSHPITPAQDSCRIAASASTVAVPPHTRQFDETVRHFCPRPVAARCNCLPSSRLVSQEDQDYFLSFSHRRFGDLILAFNGPAQLLVFTYTTLLWRFTHSFTHLNLTYTKPRNCLLRIPAQAFSHHSLGLQILRQKPICL